MLALLSFAISVAVAVLGWWVVVLLERDPNGPGKDHVIWPLFAMLFGVVGALGSLIVLLKSIFG